MDLFIVLAAAILPALVLVYFIYRKDKYEKEPAEQLIKGFGFGALAALASFLISFPLTLIGLYSTNAVSVSDSIKTAVFGAAIPEELSKFFFLWLLLKNNRHFNEYVDGIVNAVCVGMGFAALENIMYLLSSLDNWVVVGVTRGLFSVPAHFFFAVLMGYYYSKATFDHVLKPAHSWWQTVPRPCSATPVYHLFHPLCVALFPLHAVFS